MYRQEGKGRQVWKVRLAGKGRYVVGRQICKIRQTGRQTRPRRHAWARRHGGSQSRGGK
jgi:hypothetical protein